jgi:RND family efflux transporter MFP subunit
MTRIPFILLALVAASAAACNNAHDLRESVTRTPLPVNTARVSFEQAAERLEAGGVVAAAQSAMLSARLVAPVVEVRVKAGDRVNAGDVLLTLDGRDVADQARHATATATAAEKTLAQARSAQVAADAEHKLATAWHGRIRELHSRKSATEHERDEADARLASAAARAAGARAAIDVAEANVAAARAAAGAALTTESFTIIRAPFDALVTERLIDPGNLAAPGTPLLRVESVGERRVEVTVDESRARFINPGDRAEVIVDGAGDNGGDAAMAGTVSEVARLIAADRRAFMVKVVLPPHSSARTGSFARVVFRGAPTRTLVIPQDAVRRHGQVASVFVVADNQARMRLIQLGESFGDTVSVLAGLEAGEMVVTTPAPELVDGYPVTTQAGARQ